MNEWLGRHRAQDLRSTWENKRLEKTVRVFHSFEEADAAEVENDVRMTPQERIAKRGTDEGLAISDRYNYARDGVKLR